MGTGLVSAVLIMSHPGTAAEPSTDSASQVETQPKNHAANPLALLYTSRLKQVNGQPIDQLQLYETVLQQHPPDSFWGQWAILGLVRQHLAGTSSPNPAAARETLGRLPEKLVHDALTDQRRLWQCILAIHDEAARVLADESYHLTFDAFANQTLPPVPPRLRADVQWAVELIARRFENQQQPRRGARCFASLLQTLEQPTLQAACLKNLADLRLTGGDLAGAAAAARAYWLTCVERPARLPRAIDTVTAVMQAQGADAEALRTFRFQQVQGSDPNAARAAILRPATDSSDMHPLFSNSRIQRAASSLQQARMHLLNGDLQASVPILQEALASPDASLNQSDNVLMLIRMAFALHDGHMHRIGRYEQYLAQADAGNGGENPLTVLAEGNADQQAHATQP